MRNHTEEMKNRSAGFGKYIFRPALFIRKKSSEKNSGEYGVWMLYLDIGYGYIKKQINAQQITMFWVEVVVLEEICPNQVFD